ncbi:MAG: serine hydrolase family protein [Anaerolineae bacterium]|nr:serine hydrolase family protein [Anaerolineae bacterium]
MAASSDKQQVLFFQGAGDGAYEEDEKLADSLQKELGSGYEVHYPRMPDNDSNDEWAEQIGEEIGSIESEVVLVAHSVGASTLLKYLADNEGELKQPIAGIFLMATPFWGGDKGWQYEGFTMTRDFQDKLPKDVPIFLYHNRDDEIVPFDHLALYAEKLQSVTLREGASGGHQFDDDLTTVAADIKKLQ